jgi:hypothetical protein
MAKPQYIHGESYGLLYRFSRGNWKRMLQLIATGKEVNYDDYGDCIGQLDAPGLSDLGEERAKELLEGLK